jgi:ribonuclease HI
MSGKSKYYVVWKGYEPGVYSDWQSCERQVKGYPEPRFKSFASREEAEEAFHKPEKAFIIKAQKARSTQSSGDIIADSISVDAACSGNPGRLEYRGVHTTTKEPFFAMGPFEDGTNNIGEFLAIVHALALMEKNKISLPIYSDSATAQAWIRGKKARTKLERTGRNDKLFELISRAEQYLQTHPVKVDIIKWDTKNWGEIPADYDRK